MRKGMQDNGRNGVGWKYKWKGKWKGTGMEWNGAGRVCAAGPGVIQHAESIREHSALCRERERERDRK
jgi:hypothetical protein